MKRTILRLFRTRYLHLVLGILVSSGIATSVAAARSWNPSQRDLAQDYLQIMHVRAENSITMLWWIAPPMMSGQNVEIAKLLLDRYVIVAAVNARVSPEGTWSFPSADAPQVADVSGRQLRLLTGDNLPPAVQGIIAALQGTLRQGIGAMGQGMQFFAFEGGAARACQKGVLSVQYLDETYTWDTPVPGC